MRGTGERATDARYGEEGDLRVMITCSGWGKGCLGELVMGTNSKLLLGDRRVWQLLYDESSRRRIYRKSYTA